MYDEQFVDVKSNKVLFVFEINSGLLIFEDFIHTLNKRLYVQCSSDLRYSKGDGFCKGRFIRKGDKASLVTIHSETTDNAFFPVKGPNGNDSQDWISRRDISFKSKYPKI